VIAGRPKGGAGLENEFYACVNKLRNISIDGIDERRLVLIYERDNRRDQRRKRTLHGSYGQLTESSAIAQVWALTDGPLEARILRPAPSPRPDLSAATTPSPPKGRS
jgi:hypothetical protein